MNTGPFIGYYEVYLAEWRDSKLNTLYDASINGPTVTNQ